MVEHYKGDTLKYKKLYVGNSEFIVGPDGSVKIKRTFITAPTGICAVYQDSLGMKTMHYVHTDHLGSWLAITDSTGQVENRYSYDAWGRPRNPSTWALLPVDTAKVLVSLNAMQPRFDRGYTGHEGMAGFGLINMNGRLYDPYLQRFLSPDMVVQQPDNAQNYNRYTYCLNNPLMYIDPSGYQSMSLFQFLNIVMSTNCPYGGYWESNGRGGGGSGTIYTKPEQAYQGGTEYNDFHDSWENTKYQHGADVVKHRPKKYHLGRNITYYVNGEGHWHTNKEEAIYYTFKKRDPSQGDDSYYYGVEGDGYNGVNFGLGVKGQKYSEYNWVQTCKQEGTPAFSDPKHKPNDGFFYSQSEIDENKTKFHPTWDGWFGDDPRTYDGTGQSFELTLVGKNNGTWKPIITYSWGYTVQDGKTILLPLIRIYNPSPEHLLNLEEALRLHNP